MPWGAVTRFVHVFEAQAPGTKSTVLDRECLPQQGTDTLCRSLRMEVASSPLSPGSEALDQMTVLSALMTNQTGLLPPILEAGHKGIGEPTMRP